MNKSHTEYVLCILQMLTINGVWFFKCAEDCILDVNIQLSNEEMDDFLYTTFDDSPIGYLYDDYTFDLYL